VLLLQATPDEDELVEVIVLPPTCLSYGVVKAVDEGYSSVELVAPGCGAVEVRRYNSPVTGLWPTRRHKKQWRRQL